MDLSSISFRKSRSALGFVPWFFSAVSKAAGSRLSSMSAIATILAVLLRENESTSESARPPAPITPTRTVSLGGALPQTEETVPAAAAAIELCRKLRLRLGIENSLGSLERR